MEEQDTVETDSTDEHASQNTLNPVDAYRRNKMMEEAIVADVTVREEEQDKQRGEGKQRVVRADLTLDLPYGDQQINEELTPDEVNTLLEARGYDSKTASVRDLVGEPVEITEQRRSNEWTMESPSAMLNATEQDSDDETAVTTETLDSIEHKLEFLHVAVGVPWYLSVMFCGPIVGLALLLGGLVITPFLIHAVSVVALLGVLHMLLTVARLNIWRAKIANGDAEPDDAAPYLERYLKQSDDWGLAREVLFRLGY